MAVSVDPSLPPPITLITLFTLSATVLRACRADAINPSVSCPHRSRISQWFLRSHGTQRALNVLKDFVEMSDHGASGLPVMRLRSRGIPSLIALVQRL
ncbi:hypothetical protein RB195_002006 [Necator americanus]|uniref:Secreted protein n=1 Tax=Necator americanus TaxID=51031 RepID=A0ABR1DH53_NECAM